MALTATDEEMIRPADIFGWSIKMLDENETIVAVRVSDDVFEDLMAGGLSENEARKRVEEIASVKHSLGEIEKEGVHIRSDDLSAA